MTTRTLTKPRARGRYPAVLLITGSGAQNRNEETLGHKPFMVIADALTRRGIAVLRVDDRGVGALTRFRTRTRPARIPTWARCKLVQLACERLSGSVEPFRDVWTRSTLATRCGESPALP